MKKTAVIYITEKDGKQETQTFNLTNKTQYDAYKVFVVDLLLCDHERITIDFFD